MILRRLVGPLALLILVTLPAPPIGGAQVAKHEFDLAAAEALVTSTVTSAMAAEHIPGVSFALVKDGKIVLAKGFGVADVERVTPVSATDTIFRIGSITKALTAQGIMQMADMHRISLDEDVNRYLTKFKVDARYPAPVRFRHLITHTAGFDQVGDAGREAATPADRALLGDYLSRTLRRTRPPGQVSSYDTWGITLAGYLLEVLSGMPYADFMKSNIFRPLGMNFANVETPAALRPQLASGYRYAQGKFVSQAYEYYTTTPASSIDATATDMAKLMIAILGDGSADGHTAFISRRTLETYREIQFSNAQGFPAYSYGFKEEITNGQRVLRHGGNMNGFASDLFMLPAHGLGAFVVYNSDREIGGPVVRLRDTLYQKLMDAWFPREAPAPRPPVAVDTTRFGGKYADNMYCHSCFEGEPGAWPIAGIDAITAVPNGIEAGGVRWNAVGPLTFQSERTGNLVTFREDTRGRITHLISRSGVQERLDVPLLEESLGDGWASAAPAPLAAIVFSQLGDWTRCAGAYDAIAAARPGDGNAAFNGGVCWAQAGKGDKAIDSLQRAWTLKERPQRTAFWLGAAYGLAEDNGHAFEWLNRALDLGFDKRRLTTEKILDGLRADPRFELLLKR